jgi:hypothetical protein
MWWSIRGWWEFHRTAVIGLLVAVLIGVGMMWAVGLFSAAEAATGWITGFGLSVGRSPHGMALVQVDGRQAEIRDPQDSRCRIGSRIALERRQSLIGPRYSAAQTPCRR